MLLVSAFPIMLLKLAFSFMLLEIPLYAKKNAQIMLDSQNNATLVSENALFNFKQNVESRASCVYQQLNKVKSVQQSKLVQ